MRAYKTNSPLYLDYVASVYTRQQIMADPDLCLLLQNQYIKDNMEIALKWNAAKFGDYKDKVEFMEFFMCNGPQLDADTILHYRGLAYGDPACVEIAYSYFADGEKVMNIRQTKYGKKSGRDLWDCFKNPCFYMGRFSSTMGKSSDTENTASFWNVMASSFEMLFQSSEARAQRKENEANKNGTPTKTAQQQNLGAAAEKAVRKAASQTPVAPQQTNPQQNPKPAISKSFTGWLLYGFTQGNAAWQKSIMDGDAEWIKNGIEKKGEDFKKWLSDTRIGDWYSNAIQGITQIATKANTKRHLGDCARLWKQLRTLRWYQESSNNVRPVSQSQVVGNKQTDGTNTKPVQQQQPTAGQITSGVSGNS